MCANKKFDEAEQILRSAARVNKLDIAYPILDIDNTLRANGTIIKDASQEAEVVYDKTDARPEEDGKQTNGNVDVELPKPEATPATKVSLLTIIRHRTLCLYLILSCLLW